MDLKKFIIIQILIFNVFLFAATTKNKEVKGHQNLFSVIEQTDNIPQERIINPKISNPLPDYLNYDQIISQIKEWNEEASEITKVGKYGKSSGGKDLYYFRICHPENQNKPKVLLTASIHGNEPLSTSVMMAYAGSILDKYGEDPEITELVKTRDIYLIPVVCPDSYPHRRYVGGVDPNRNFPTEDNPNKRSIDSIQNLRDFFLRIKPNAVISGHTFGRLYLIPWGDKRALCPNNSDYEKIIGKMGLMSHYDMMRACNMYRQPIHGTEVDWYYRNGAFSIIMEMGNHQRIPEYSETKGEFDRTFKAVLYFIDKGPLVEV